MWDFFYFYVRLHLQKQKGCIMEKPNMIVFMGGQGSGKGTYAKLFLKQNDCNYIETGAILRQMPKNSEIGKKIARGELVSDDELFAIIAEHIKNNKDLILDGFPRTLGQAKWLVKNYKNQFIIKVAFLNITKKMMLARIQNRIKEGENRADDNDAAAVQKRIAAFYATTMPAIEWLSKQPKIQFCDIKVPNPADTIENNFKYVQDRLMEPQMCSTKEHKR